jgi:hypothetical protein
MTARRLAQHRTIRQANAELPLGTLGLLAAPASIESREKRGSGTLAGAASFGCFALSSSN